MIIGEEWSGTVREKSLSRREKNIVGPLFPEGSRQLERFLGEDSVLGRRTGLHHGLHNGTLPLERRVE